MSFEEWQRQFDEPVPVPVVEKPTNGFAAWEAQLDTPVRPMDVIKAGKQELAVTQDQMRAEAQSPERYKIQQLLGLNPNLTPDQASKAAIGLTSSKFDNMVELVKRTKAGVDFDELQTKVNMQEAYGGGGTKKEREQAADLVVSSAMESLVGKNQEQTQAIADAAIMRRNQELLKGEFLQKTARRWDRGVVNTIGGGMYFMDTLTRAMGVSDGSWAEQARITHEILQQPHFQPVIENAFDKYFGAGVETAPFMIATMVPHILTGGTTVAASVGSFLVAFGIEGNNTYQNALDRGVSEQEARMRGFTVGVLNGIIEMAGGSGGKYLKSAAGKKVTNLWGKMRRAGSHAAKNALKEGFLEELPQELISMLAGGDIPRNEDGTVNWGEVFDRGWDAAITGTILGGAMGAPGAISTGIKTKIQKPGTTPLVNAPVVADMAVDKTTTEDGKVFGNADEVVKQFHENEKAEFFGFAKPIFNEKDSIGQQKDIAKASLTQAIDSLQLRVLDQRERDRIVDLAVKTAFTEASKNGVYDDKILAARMYEVVSNEVIRGQVDTMSFEEWQEFKNPFKYGKTNAQDYGPIKNQKKQYRMYVNTQKTIKSGVAALENMSNPTPIQTEVADRNVKLRVGHDIAKKMGMKDKEFETYKQTYGGQSSMADMDDQQLNAFVEQLQQDGTDAGLSAEDVAITMTPTEELIKQSKASRGYKETTELQRSLRGVVRKKTDWVIDKWHGYWKVQDRVRNMARALDNYEDGGPFQRLLWDPIKGVRTRKEQSWNGMLRGMQMTWVEAGVDVGAMMDTKRNDIIITKDGEGMPRSHADFIGLYLISKDKKNRVRTSAWFTKNNIDPTKTWANIKELVESNEQMKLVADSVHAYFRDRGPVFVQTANDMGIKSISKDGASEDITLEQDYFPMLSENPDMVTGEDIIDVFEERYSQHLQIPGKQHTKKRTGGDEKTEWNVFRNFARVSNKMESLIEVGPVAQQVYKMVSDKRVRRAINNATNGKGATIIDKWIRDSARGSSTYNITDLDRLVANMRTNSVQYTLGLKLFTSAPKAILSLVNGLANNPAMIPSVFSVLLEYRTLSGLNKIKNEVYSKSDIMQNRDPVRDIRTMWNDKTIKKFFAGKNVSPLNLRYWTFLDKATANAVWMGAYRLAKTKMGEMDARKWADTRAQESQPMASVEDLPDIFRGSELGKTLTTFMGMLNTTQQYLKHDIIGEYRAGKISGQKATYRFMMGEIVPALILGVITRGRLPETPREMLEDVISYLLSPAVFLGRFIFQAGRMSIDAALGVKSKSYDPVKSGISLIPLRAFEEAARLGVAIGKGEGADIVEKAASTFGAGTGLLPEQGVITARGAYDLATGVTTDWWRLTRTEGNLKYNAPAKRSGARRKRSGQRSRRQARSRRD